MNKIYIYCLWLCGLCSCMAGPKFSPPVVDVPTSYIGAQTDTLQELSWWAGFGDTTLIRLIETALEQNRNVAMAFSAVEQARISLNAARAERWPTLGYALGGQYGNETYIGTKSDKPEQSYSIKPSITWEIGLFGAVRRMNEAQRAELFASQMAARGVLISLVSEVASTYFTYLQYEYALQAARQIAQTAQQTYDLQRHSYELGQIAELDFQQAAVGFHQAQAAVSEMQRALTQTQYALSLLLGQNPASVVGVHTPLTELPLPDPVAAGLPSDLLNRRPDIMQAYYKCMAANAMVGVAQARRLPSIALTGSGGLLSLEFKELFKGETWLWSGAASIAGPLLSFGKYKRQTELAREKSLEAVLSYQQSVLVALDDVESSLVAVSSLRTQTESLAALRLAAQTSYDLSQKLYAYGQINAQNLLASQQNMLHAQTTYAESMSSLMSSYATLYKSLGGEF